MKHFIKYLYLLFLSAATTLFYSCDSSGTDGFVAAPETMNGLSLSPFADEIMVFDFRRIDGDASNGGFEFGICNSIDVNGSGTLFQTAPAFEYPIRVSALRYSYTQTGDNSGIVNITGDGRGDGLGILNPPDIFVNNPDGSRWNATFSITFGTSGAEVGEIAVETFFTGTTIGLGVTGNIDSDGDGVDDANDTDADGDGIPDISDPEVNIFSVTDGLTSVQNTARNGIFIQTQEGNPVPIGYNQGSSSLIQQTTPPTLVPTDLSDSGILIMNFSPGANPEASRYFFFGVSSDDRGFTSATLLDQGIYSLDIVAVDGVSVTTESDVDYAWESDALGFDEATLTIVRSTPNAAGGIDNTTERYLFTFDTLRSGTFTQIQPDTGATGDFLFPSLDR